MEAVKLAELLIQEVSGVDRPANQLDGWMVAKSADLPGEPTAPEVPPTTTLKERLLGLFPARKDDIEMTSEELTAALDARDEALVEKFAEVVKSAVVPVEGTPEVTAPATPEAPAPEAPATEAVAALIPEDMTKAIQEALAPYNEILEKVLDRFEPIERQLGVTARKSLEGQETSAPGAEEAPTPTVKDAIGAALRGRQVALR